MLRLLSLLQSHRDWGGAELADRLEVSPRTLRRDIDRLRTLGYPVDASPGVAGGYRLAAGASMPPLVLEDDEAVALVVALRASARSAISGTAEASVDTLTKVVQVLPPRLRRRAEDVAQMTQTADWSEITDTVDRERVGDDRDGGTELRAGGVLVSGSGRCGGGSSCRADQTRHARPPLVPRRLRPDAARLADVPSRPDHRARFDRCAVPTEARADRRRRRVRPLVDPGRHDGVGDRGRGRDERRRGAPPPRATGGGHRSRSGTVPSSRSRPTGSTGRRCCSPRSTPISASSHPLSSVPTWRPSGAGSASRRSRSRDRVHLNAIT